MNEWNLGSRIKEEKEEEEGHRVNNGAFLIVTERTISTGAVTTPALSSCPLWGLSYR